jgi:sorbitol/mannitol transport system substrate-binding protein
MTFKTFLLGACSALAFAGMASAETLTIATVNNGDMVRMQKLTDDFKTKNPGIDLEWVTLEENVLRQKVTTDIATKGGQYDVLTIGNYEVPIWAKQGWLLPLDTLGEKYDTKDLLPAIGAALTVDNKLYAVPFYGESAMIMYRTDLFEKAGLKMPENPTWDFIADAARKITDKDKEIYGMCLRGKAGWGENMAFLTALDNSFGGRWFDENWKPQIRRFARVEGKRCGMWINLKFVAWATDKAYGELVAGKEGWANVPPGTRTSLYENADYQKAAPFAAKTLDAMKAADTQKPTVKPVPYTGGQFVAIPEFQGIGTAVGQQFSAALAGQLSVDQALQSAQQLTTREMTKAGYIK